LGINTGTEIEKLLGLKFKPEKNMNIIAALNQEATKLEHRLSAIRTAIGALNGNGTDKTVRTERTTARRYTHSASARRRIGLAVKRRWMEKNGNGTGKSVGVEAPRPRRTMSAAGRRRIILATKRRWAKYRAEKNDNAQPRRVMSAATKRKLSIAAKARWAARAK
jgi:hypothetical protein